MKAKLGLAFLMAATSLSLSGCVFHVGGSEGKHSDSYWETQQQTNRANLSKLTMGMARDQVTILMGTADFSEAYVTQADAESPKKEVNVLFYRTQWSKGDGKTTKDECTPVVISDNKLVGWGDTAYQKI
ncbi:MULTISPECIES: DUF3192 domain-containing protein [Shewanella]|uniref:DUF3192 domain-containing protein n=1 Tax=Shewanella TaxID=22 RepID=UPI001BC2527C|nr:MULTISPECIES: DUF3192 domain-containing protein [Shewanella]GIU52148.1 hypothetical protein TUM4249_20400 [Shewanella sp. KT0246]